MILEQISKKVRYFVARLFPYRFPSLYSTLDNPMEVPVQVAAYELAIQKYLHPTDSVLDVGFGLGYGLKLMATVADDLVGIDIDRRVVTKGQSLIEEVPQITQVRHYDGLTIPFDDDNFEIVTCVDVLEHVPDYGAFLRELVRVAKRAVLISTPSRRPEHTNANGSPKNPWHLREWTYEELNDILEDIPEITVDWNFIDGPWEGPFEYKTVASEAIMALTPALLL